MLRPLNEELLKIQFSVQGRLLASCRIERETFYPGLGLEPGPLLAVCAKPSRTSTDP